PAHRIPAFAGDGGQPRRYDFSGGLRGIAATTGVFASEALVRSALAALVRRLRGPSHLRIAVVVPAIAKADGSSKAIQHTIRAVSSVPGWSLSVFCKACEIEALPVRTVAGVADVLKDEHFRAADVILYHFGLHDELFEIMKEGNGK